MKIKFLICAALVAVSVSMNATAEAKRQKIGPWSVAHIAIGNGLMTTGDEESAQLNLTCFSNRCSWMMFLLTPCEMGREYEYTLLGTNARGRLVCRSNSTDMGLYVFADHELAMSHFVNNGRVNFRVHHDNGTYEDASFDVTQVHDAVLFMVGGGRY